MFEDPRMLPMKLETQPEPDLPFDRMEEVRDTRAYVSYFDEFIELDGIPYFETYSRLHRLQLFCILLESIKE